MSDEIEQLEKYFLKTWDRMELFYTRIPQMASLVSEIRASGYSKKLRAGQSLNTFIISRSRHKGLKKGFSSIRIDANSDGSMKVTKRFDDTSSEYYFKTIELHTKLIEMLDELASRPIDTWQPNK